MERIADKLFKTSLFSDTKLKKPSIYFLIIVTAVISATTEYYFLYNNSAYPMFKNVATAGIISLIAVSFIEALKIIGFKSFIESFGNSLATIALLFLVVIPSAGVSWYISLSGAYAIQEKSQTPPHTISTSYKDSVNTYYSMLITNIRTNPSSSTNKKIESITIDINTLKSEIKEAKKDKRNYIGSEMVWGVRKTINRKEKTLTTLLSTKNKLIVNDQSGIDAEKEISRLEEEKRVKLKEIQEAKETFQGLQSNEKTNAFWYIIFNEFFGLVLNFLYTFTDKHRSESKEESEEKKEREINKVLERYHRNRYASRKEAQRALASAETRGASRNPVNAGKLQKMYMGWCEEYNKNPNKTNRHATTQQRHATTQNETSFSNN